MFVDFMMFSFSSIIFLILLYSVKTLLHLDTDMPFDLDGDVCKWQSLEQMHSTNRLTSGFDAGPEFWPSIHLFNQKERRKISCSLWNGQAVTKNISKT